MIKNLPFRLMHELALEWNMEIQNLIHSKTFIWLPFAGGISAFAVILPKPMGTGHGVAGGYPDARPT